MNKLFSRFHQTRPIDRTRIQHAYQKALNDLLHERDDSGRWTGELASSALSTATAISALTMYIREARLPDRNEKTTAQQQILAGLRYLANHQNKDGGWGDTDKSYSNISTSTLVVAAIALQADDTKREFSDQLSRANKYLQEFGGVENIKARYGKDRTFAVPILANAAFAGLVDWKQVGILPFEAAVVPSLP